MKGVLPHSVATCTNRSRSEIGRTYSVFENFEKSGQKLVFRHKLSEEFVAEVYAGWCEHGAVAIQTVRETRPDVYVKVVVRCAPPSAGRSDWAYSRGACG